MKLKKAYTEFLAEFAARWQTQQAKDRPQWRAYLHGEAIRLRDRAHCLACPGSAFIRWGNGRCWMADVVKDIVLPELPLSVQDRHLFAAAMDHAAHHWPAQLPLHATAVTVALREQHTPHERRVAVELRRQVLEILGLAMAAL